MNFISLDIRKKVKIYCAVKLKFKGKTIANVRGDKVRKSTGSNTIFRDDIN